MRRCGRWATPPTAGADIGEVVTTAARITAGDYGSWYEQWAATAHRVEAEARAQLAAGGRDGRDTAVLRVSAGGCRLRSGQRRGWRRPARGCGR
jgi:hypothetical protein